MDYSEKHKLWKKPIKSIIEELEWQLERMS